MHRNDTPVWRHWIAELSRDHMLVRYDESGCGLSDWSVPELSFAAWVRDLESVADAAGLERFALLGSRRARRYAAAAPRPRGSTISQCSR